METDELDRVRVYVMGSQGCGKTTVINTILGQTNVPPDRGEITVYQGAPVGVHHQEEGDHGHLQLDIWELPGNKVLRGTYHVVLTEPAVYIVLVSADTDNSVLEAIELCQDIHAKICKPHIIVVVTQRSSGQGQKADNDGVCRLIKDRWIEILAQKAHIESNTRLSFKPEVPSNQSSEHFESGSFTVQPFITSDSQCLEQLTSILIRCASGIQTNNDYSVSTHPCLQSTLEFIRKKRRERIMFVRKHQFPDSSCSLSSYETAYDYLCQCRGYVQEFTSVSKTDVDPVVCVDPLAFANLLMRSHLDAGSRVFRLESGKFWPPDTDRPPPDPTVLADILEDIKNSGVVAESFLPILWNTPYIRREQIEMVLRVMESLGLMCPALKHGQPFDPAPPIELPFFTYLLGENKHRIMLMNKLSSYRPVLHWSETPQRGDFQITVHFTFTYIIPTGLHQRVLAICFNITRPFTRYHHIWQNGVLLQLGQEVKVHVLTIKNKVDFTARVVADSFPDLKAATKVLWVTVAPCLHKLSQLFSSFPGLAIETLLSFRGDPAFDEVFREGSTTRRLTVAQLVSKQLLHTESMSTKWIIPFKVSSDVRSFETWVEFLLENRSDVLQILAPYLLFAPPTDPATEPPTMSTPPDPPKQKTSGKISKVRFRIDSEIENAKNSKSETTLKQAASTARELVDHGSTDIVISDTTKNSSLISGGPLQNGTSVVFDQQIAYKVASSLSASVMTSGVAKFMEEENAMSKKWSPAQVLAVRDISLLSKSVWEGDMENMTSAIANAVASNHRPQNDTRAPTISTTRLCTIL